MDATIEVSHFAIDQHLEGLLDLEGACFEHHCGWLHRDDWDEYLNNGGMVHIGHDIESGKAVCYYAIEPVGDTVSLTSIAVLPEYRRCGVATWLIEEMEDRIREFSRRRLVKAFVPESVECAIGLFSACGYSARLAHLEHEAPDAKGQDYYLFEKGLVSYEREACEA